MRVFFTADGCQLRVNSHIVTCGADEAHLLRTAVGAGSAQTSGPQDAGWGTPRLSDAMDTLLATLRRVGAPTDAVSPLRELASVPASERR
jgi:hypothetical protein